MKVPITARRSSSLRAAAPSSWKNGSEVTIEKVEATGSHTVKFTLKQPQAPFLQNIATFPFAMASPKAVEKWGTDFGKHPVGTGAFKFVEWKPNQEVVLDANTDYWGAKPKVKRVIVRNIKDNSQRVAALKAGEVHGIEGINPDDLKNPAI